MASVAERVARGVALLDEKVPGWLERVNLEWLDITSCYFCVLGQVFADADTSFTPYGAGMETLGLARPHRGVVWHGFDGAQLDQLNDEWRRVITERRAAQ